MNVPTRHTSTRHLRRQFRCVACGAVALDSDYCPKCLDEQNAITAPLMSALVDAILQDVVSLVDGPPTWSPPGGAVWTAPRTRAEAVRCAAACVRLALGLPA